MFTGSFGSTQGIQITGLDPSLLTQTVQIDASLLQQLQQQGNINLAINPNNLHSLQTADPNMVQNIQIQQADTPTDPTDAVNPNVIIQPMSNLTQTAIVQENGQLLTADGQVIGTTVDMPMAEASTSHDNQQHSIIQSQIGIDTSQHVVQQEQHTTLQQQQIEVSINIDDDDDDDDDDDNNDMVPEGVSEDNLEHLHVDQSAIRITNIMDGVTSQETEPSQSLTEIQVQVAPQGEVQTTEGLQVVSAETINTEPVTTTQPGTTETVVAISSVAPQLAEQAIASQLQHIIIQPTTIQVHPSDPQRSHICTVSI